MSSALILHRHWGSFYREAASTRWPSVQPLRRYQSRRLTLGRRRSPAFHRPGARARSSVSSVSRHTYAKRLHSRLAGHHQGHEHPHGHSHGRIDPSVVRSREGLRAVLISLAVLGLTALAQVGVYLLSGSVALLADLVHNAGDALTAIPVGAAFLLRSPRAERWAGYAVVLAIFVSACVAFWQSIERLIHPEELSYLWALAAAGALGFVGNEIAAQVRLRAGRRLDSPALIADGHHARVDGFVSLGVVLSAGLVALGASRADPLVGLAITLVILRVTWEAWRTVRRG